MPRPTLKLKRNFFIDILIMKLWDFINHMVWLSIDEYLHTSLNFFSLLFCSVGWYEVLTSSAQKKSVNGENWRLVRILSSSCRRIMRLFSFLTESVLNLAKDVFCSQFIFLLFLGRWCNTTQIFVGMLKNLKWDVILLLFWGFHVKCLFNW